MTRRQISVETSDRRFSTGLELVSVLVPTIDETESLVETVREVVEDARPAVLEVVIVTCERTTSRTLAACADLRNKYGEQVAIVRQTLPHLGGAFRSGIEAAHGSRIVLMFADLESDPHLVSEMAAAADAEPTAIISASRWLRRGGFVRYVRMKLVLNFCFQHFCALICHRHLTDFTYGFRLYPASVLRSYEWQETDHAFVLESILKPLNDGIRVREVPAVWTARKEGERRSRSKQYLRYLPTLARIVTGSKSHERRADVGRTGASPFPGGRPARWRWSRRATASARAATLYQTSGEAPDGTGGAPVLPGIVVPTS